MAKINKLEIYSRTTPIDGQDFLVGTEGKSQKTRSFFLNDIGNFVAELIGVNPIVSAGLVSVESIVSDGLFVTVTNAVYRINGSEYTISAEIELDPIEEGLQRIDSIVANEEGISILEGTPADENPAQPGIPQGYVLLGIITIGEETTTTEPQIGGIRVYQGLLYIKRQGNLNNNIIQIGDIVFGFMSDNNTFLPFGVYKGGSYFDANSYSVNALDFSDTPATNLP